MSVNAAIFGLSGPELTAGEAAFFRDCNPWAFILFARNIETPEQVRKLCADLRDCVGRDALIFTDQEGGRVQRFTKPHWKKLPWAWAIGELFSLNEYAGLRASWLHFRIIAEQLRGVGVTANCAPVIDLPVFGADKIISDRAFSRSPEKMVRLANAAIAGMTAGGISPVIKHIPGHGRAKVDSHKALPVIEENLDVLDQTDFATFRALNDVPMAMTAHLILECVDKNLPVTVSKSAINQVIRGRLGYDGLLMSDDLDMKALSGSLTKKAEQTLAAGCDVVLQCSGNLPDMVKVAKGLSPLTESGKRRAAIASYLSDTVEEFDVEFAENQYNSLMSALPDFQHKNANMSGDIEDDLDFEAADDAAEEGGGLIIDIDGYEGPLHLLLELARMQKVDLSRISILELAEQYIAFIKSAQDLRIELAADYLVMASWLAYLKSRLILPKAEAEAQLPQAEELAAHLAFRLQRLDAMRIASQSLFKLPVTGQSVFVRGAPEGLRSRTSPLYQAEVFDLLKAYGEIRSQATMRNHTLPRPLVLALDEARKRLERALGFSLEWMTLDDLIPASSDFVKNLPPKSIRASSFLAGLELAKEGKLELKQSTAFAPIYLRSVKKETLDD